MTTLALLRYGFPYEALDAMPADEARDYLACASAAAFVASERAKEDAWLQRQGVMTGHG